jgi:hypothetical protein
LRSNDLVPLAPTLRDRVAVVALCRPYVEYRMLRASILTVYLQREDMHQLCLLLGDMLAVGSILLPSGFMQVLSSMLLGGAFELG